MADVAEEDGFGAIQFGKGFSPPPFLLVSLGFRDRVSDLLSD